MHRYYFLLIIVTILGAFGSFFFKKTANSMAGLSSLLSNKYLYFGGLLYIASFVLNIIVLKYLPYFAVFTLTSITYIWTTIISFFLLKEKINFLKIISIFLIITGSVFLVIK